MSINMHLDLDHYTYQILPSLVKPNSTIISQGSTYHFFYCFKKIETTMRYTYAVTLAILTFWAPKKNHIRGRRHDMLNLNYLLGG